MTNSTTYRGKEQVLLELAKALNFSPASLEANRKGKLAGDQFMALFGKFATPTFMTVLFAAAPFVIWGVLTGEKQQASFSAGLQIFLGQIMHIGELADDQGKFAVVTRVGSLLVSLGLAALFASRVSMGLYFDLLERAVVVKEGRITAREDQTIRPNGRDPIEKYYFDLKTDRFPVNLAAYRAIENGSVYLLYVLPRSRQLVAIEPKP
ncbi:MAG TPA: hypothetical protein VNV82_08500 [Bryobacteraceae bacterium]|nr:hypothetical protein [Bryobacteraceae bacterium]